MTIPAEARLSIVAYKPKPGKEAELLAMTRGHVPFLQTLGLATGRASMIAMAADGTVVEVFEWAEGGLEKAHTHPDIAGLWARYATVCDYVPLSTLAECNQLFANFVPVEEADA